MKAIRSNTNISPHGGAVPILKKLQEFGIPQVIRSILGVRKKQSKYEFSDIFIAWVLTSLCGGTRLEHITKLKKKLSIIPELKLPSHDTLGRVMKQLASEVTTVKNVQNKGLAYTQKNENILLNKMLVHASKAARAIEENKSYTVSIDATFIPTECRGAVRKKNLEGKIDYSRIGFNPMICFIDNMPVFVSMRDGYANGHFELNNCLQNCLNLLSDANIKVDRVISDAAGYNKKAFEELQANNIKFIVRFPFGSKMETFKAALISCDKWRKSEIETANFNWSCEVGDIPYKMHDDYSLGYVSPTWRVVAMRIPIVETDTDARTALELNNKKLKILSNNKKLKEYGKSNHEGKWVFIGNYKYKFIITNDYEKKAEELIVEYNKRGTTERVISFMKNDFGWRLPPFMNMNENTVFLIASSLANNIFKGMVRVFKESIPELRLNMRLREFQFVFMDVACALIKGVYQFFKTDIAYEKIM
ncbi:MAG TPA: transposase [Bacteroidia bacterium]|nr:transposase [Bacteroidia bacterium]